jgi:hypothetical protein
VRSPSRITRVACSSVGEGAADSSPATESIVCIPSRTELHLLGHVALAVVCDKYGHEAHRQARRGK